MKTLTLTLLLSGCTLNPYKDMTGEEKAWQIMHGIDILQTQDIGQSKCFQEVGQVTSKLIGNKPNTAQVLAWGAGLSYGHAQVTNWLERSKTPKWLKTTITTVDLALKMNIIADNYYIGVRIGSDNKPRHRCKP